jgi:hypothetical protein
MLARKNQFLICLCILFFSVNLSAEDYVCGDHNSDGTVNVGDAVSMISYVFRGGEECYPPEAGDANCDGSVDVADAVHIINYIFRYGTKPYCVCPPIEQHILFEMCYSNFAWGAVYQGYYIDNDGYVRSYSYSSGDIVYPPPAWDEVHNEDQLMYRYGHNPGVIAQIPHNILYQKFDMVTDAAEGPLSPAVFRCFDFGMAYYVAYVYDTDAALYTPVLLYRHGDWAQKNFAPEAEALFEWMLSITGESLEDIWCGYPE